MSQDPLADAAEDANGDARAGANGDAHAGAKGDAAEDAHAEDANGDASGDAPAAAGEEAPPQPWRPVAAVALHWLGVLAVVVAGSWVGAVLAPSTPARVGPLLLDIRVVPSLHPGVQLLLPPAGRVAFDTHRAPVAVQARVREVDIDAAQALLSDPRGVAGLEAAAPDRLRSATIRAALLTGGFAVAGACALSLLVYRRVWRRTGQVAAGLVGVLVATGLTAVATFDPDQLAEPHFTGLLSRAPYVAGQAGGLLDRLESYRSGLADIVQGVTALYAASDSLPVLPASGDADLVTVLHVSDVHLNPLAFDLMDRLVKQFDVDVVVDTGDITSWGTEVESTTLSRIRGVGAPYVFVRGNHDSRRTQAVVAANPNAVVLDGDVREVAGLVFAGVGDPTFTPDAAAAVSAASSGGRPISSAVASSGPSGPSGPSASSGPSAPGSTGGSGSASGSATGSATQGAGEALPATNPEQRAGVRLADTIRGWDAEHVGRGVDIALMHQPAGVAPLLGTVPLVLAGHLHTRSVRVDASGTRVMVEGSTGGAGITSGTVDRLAAGEPVPLSATLIYLARSGERARQVVAYDEVTVGGFGLASVSLTRTVVRADEAPAPPTPGVSRTPTGTASAGAASGTPAALGRQARTHWGVAGVASARPPSITAPSITAPSITAPPITEEARGDPPAPA